MTERPLTQGQLRALETLARLGVSLASERDRTLQALAARGLAERVDRRWRATNAGLDLLAEYMPPVPKWKRPPPTRFVLVPGEVISQHDGQVHYVSAQQLAKLYGLRPGEWVPHTPATRMAEGDVVLGVRADGRYPRPHARAARWTLADAG